MAKSPRAARTRALPTLSPAPVVASAAAAWDAGEAAEAEFDYPAAHEAYRSAVIASAGAEAWRRLAAYAAFVVERFGQFEEVAAWLDDDAFAPEAGDDSESYALTRLCALAAREVRHRRAPGLVAALAERGDLWAVGEHAARLAEQGAQEAALALLDRHSGRLAPDSPAARLWATLAESRDRQESLMFGPWEDALRRRDPVATEAAWRALEPSAQASGRGRAAWTRTQALAAELAAESMRAALDAALDADDLDTAAQLAEAIARAPGASDGDTATSRALQARRRAKARHRALADAAASPLRRHHLQAVLQWPDAEAAELPAALQPAWEVAAIARAAMPQTDLTAWLPGVEALADLAEALPVGDLAAVAEARGRLPADLAHTAPARQADALLRAQRDAAEAQDEEETVAAASAALLDDDPVRAREILDERRSFRHIDVRELREAVDHALRVVGRRQALATDLARAEAEGRLFAALRAARALAETDNDGAELATAALGRLQQRRQHELLAAPIPPVGLKLEEGPVAVGVAGGRMLLVQRDLWLSVNVDTRGVAPFRLPERYRFEPSPPPRVGARDGRVRAMGRAGTRLIAVEAEPGGRPEVVQGRPLVELTRGDADVVATSWEPDGVALWLLVRPRGAESCLLVEVDGETFEVRSVLRHKPPLAGVAAVAGAPDLLVVATTMEARRKRGYAVALRDRAGAVLASADDNDLGELLHAPREAVAWPEQQRVYVRWAGLDPFRPGEIIEAPSLLVWRDTTLLFCSSDLRRRFAPNAPWNIDQAWALDRANGRLWFATLPRGEDGQDAGLLGVDAASLRAGAPVSLPGVARVIGIGGLEDGAVALCRLRDGGHALARARRQPGAAGADIALTVDRLPV